jgi:imidazolonepropionase-like amidohydrolase
MLESFGRTIEARKADAARMHQGGVVLVSGLDAGISDGKPHGLLYESVGGLAAGGVSAADALASATSVAAEGCGLGDRKGRLREGYDADVLVVAGDLATHVTALRDVSAVFRAGREVAGVVT